MSSPSPRTGFRWPPLGAEGLAAGALLLWLVPAGFTATKVLRTAPDASVFDVLVCAANNAAYALGSAVVFGAAAWLLRRRKAAAVVAPLFSLWCVTFLTLAQIEHQSWAHSGTLLDWKLLLYTAEHWGELSAVVQSEANTATWIALVLVGALGVLPAVVSWATTRWPVPPRVVRRGAVALGVAIALAAALTPFSPASRRAMAFDRSAGFVLLKGAVTSSWETATAPAERPVEETSVLVKKLLEQHPPKQSLPADGPENVLVVVMESTRTDATTVYVPSLRTTPTMASLAEHALVADRAYIDMSHTSKALVSILCGYPARWVQTIEEAKPGGLNRPCMAHLFDAVGYGTAFFQAATATFEARPQLVANMGYSHFEGQETYNDPNFARANYLALEDKVMVKPILKWVDAQRAAKKPFFLTTLTAIQHHDYGLPPGSTKQQFIDGPGPDKLFNDYLNTVAYADSYLAELVAGLKERDLFDKTLIVIVGDHGEGFMEHGRRHHNDIMWEEGIRVPLMVSNPRLWPERLAASGIRRQVDITPTVLRTLGVTFDPHWYEGRDLRDPTGHDVAQMSCWYDDQCLAERRGDVSVIYSYDTRPTEVYDLARDPKQTRDLLESAADAKTASDLAKAATKRLLARRDEIEAAYGNTSVSSSWVLKEEPLPEHVVYARLADSIEILGWDGLETVAPGGFWDITVYFRCLKPAPKGYKFLAHVETGDGRVKRTDKNASQNRYKIDECKPGEYVKYPLSLYFDPTWPDGPVTFYFGAFKGKKRLPPARTSLPVVANRVALFHPRVTGGHEPELEQLLAETIVDAPPSPTSPIGADFGDYVTLVEARVEPTSITPKGDFEVVAVWRRRELRGPWRIFIHADPSRGKPIHDDVYSAGGLLPMARWPAGKYIVDRYKLSARSNWYPGTHVKVRMGIYRDDERLRVTNPGKSTVDSDRLLVGELQVTAAPP